MASAENCGGDRRKLHRCAKAAVRIANESSIQHTGKRCQQTADDKNSKFYFANLYSPGKARDGIATDGKDAISNPGFEDHQLKHHEDDECPKYAGVDPGETAATDSVIHKLLPNCLSRGKRKTRGDGITNTLKEKQRTQRHEQGRYAEECDKNTIECADKDPAGEGGEERKTTAHDGS